jgi:hypothetical protein
MARRVIIKSTFQGVLARISSLKEMDVNHMKPFPLPDDRSASLDAELNEKQLTEITDLKWLTLPSRIPEIKQVVGTMFHAPAFKRITRATLQLSKKKERERRPGPP